ncbi:MAG TPA: cellulase family glycosylhydrolase [Chitinispirillaceae bacterium]|nr:cellulase family glycosylhydrolase [Chitinispirillaceae bacterium]
MQFKDLKLTKSPLFVLLFVGMSLAQNLPTAKSIAAEMGMAWNIGNTMEAPGNPTSWGNPLPTQQLIDAVKAAGFNTVRIPCAWDTGHVNHTTNEILPTWMAQVKQVVDYCIKDSLFVVLNIHWDGGWLEENISTAKQNEVKKKQGIYWKQIATAFKDYDRHLLFASANEPAVQDKYGTTFGADRMAVLNSYHQVFIDTVRATGGNNASRTLIIQGPRSDIELTNQVMTTLPADKITDRLMAECHFYPYQFCLMEKDEDWGKIFYYWGKNYHSTTDTERNSTWCEEKFVDSMFTFLKKQFVDRNIPVLLGEFGAMKRMTLTGDSLRLHILSRRAFYEYVCSSAKAHGVIPAAWDAGGLGDKTMTIFNRRTTEVFDLGLLNAMRNGWGMSKLPGDTSVTQTVTGANALKVLYSCTDSTFGQVELGAVKTNWSDYDSIIVRAFVNGETNYDSAGTSKYGWLSLSLVTMSKNWTWREGRFGEVSMNNWKNYHIPIGNDTTDEKAMVPADRSKIDFFALQAYSAGYRGTIYIDWIVFKSKSGTVDTLYNFNIVPSAIKGNVSGVSIISVDKVASDQEWKTATTTKWGKASPVLLTRTNSNNTVSAVASKGNLHATWFSKTPGTAQVSIKDIQGRTILNRTFNAQAGMNSLSIPTQYHGVMVIQLKHNDMSITRKVVCR